MNQKSHYFTGVLFITIGALFLLGNLGYIDWSIFKALYYLWPLILVAVGVNIVFNNHVFVRIVTFVLLVSALVVFGINFNGIVDHPKWRMNIDFDETYETVSYEEAFNDVTTKGELKVNLGAGNVNISSIDDVLYKAEIPGRIAKAEVNYSKSKKKAIVKIENDKNFLISPSLFNGDNHTYDIELNENVKWEMDIQTGAVDADLNLQELIVEFIDIDTGAGDLLVKLGDLSDLTEVSIDAGAGDVTIEIPENVGVLADVDGGIHDISLNGGDWIKENDQYKSSNYEEASSKVRINMDLGVGDVNIEHE